MANFVRHVGLLLVVFIMATGIFVKEALPGSVEKDYADFARKIETSINRGNPSVLDENINFDAIIDKAINNYTLKESLKNSYRSGVKKSLDKSSYGKRILDFMKESGSYKFLRLLKVNNEYRALFRMLDSDSGLNYYIMHLTQTKPEVIKIIDIYTFSNGELMSDTLRRGFLPIVYDTEKGIVGKLLGWESDFVKNLPKIQKMQTLSQEGKNTEALKIYYELPSSLQKDKNILILRLRYASNADEKEYEKAMQAYRSAFPNDPALDLIMIDSYVINKKYSNAIQSVNRLEKSVGGDPYLHVMRANVYYLDKKLDMAKESARKAIAEESSLVNGYWLLVSISLDEKNYKETARLLSMIENDLGIGLSDLKNAKEYAGFVSSKEYRDWMKSRKK